MRLRLRPRFRRPPVQYERIYHSHPIWALLVFLAACSWLSTAHRCQDLGGTINYYILALIHLVIAARLACARPWFTWE
jgi:hypothetical protein